MPAYVVLDIEVTDADAFAEYKELGPPAVATYGGRYLAKALRQTCARTEMLLVEGVSTGPP
jgi:uncharacterized protein (DUF1330 family)